MKIAIVVHGRFHAFNLAKALIDVGADLSVLTNYPKWAVKRFDIGPEYVKSLWPHGIVSRVALKLQQNIRTPYPDSGLDRWFGQWAAKELAREKWDAIHCWSGVAEECFQEGRNPEALKMMMRGSAHILTQARLLEEEERRTGVPMDRPSPWIILREQREYQLADVIVVLSTFSFQSFLNEGVNRSKLCLMPLGINLEHFRPSPEIVGERCLRIRSGRPLRALYVGALSFQKGLWDMEQVVRECGSEIEFRFVGPVTPEAKNVVARMSRHAVFVDKQPQDELWSSYAWGDIFVFPTIQDGFAAVLAQAQASALPVMTTTNSGGPDLIEEGKTGWILPIRSPEAFLERLRWCAAHRDELADIVEYSHGQFHPRTWADMAKDFMNVVESQRK